MELYELNELEFDCVQLAHSPGSSEVANFVGRVLSYSPECNFLQHDRNLHIGKDKSSERS